MTNRPPPPRTASRPALAAVTGVPANPVARKRFAGKRITLCVTGSVAAYKAALLVRSLLKDGAVVEVVLSRAAREFVGAATFSGLTGKRVYTDMFDAEEPGEVHVKLAKTSDLIVIAPASADVLSRLASGRADDLITALALSASCPVLAAPAMHPNMWSHPATLRNVETLHADRRVRFVGPVVGEVASGDSGLGRMAEPEPIATQISAIFAGISLSGKHIVVSAGPTAEDLDPVRFIGNRSSGKMGFALAERAAAFGARVTLVAGPVTLPTPPGVQRVDVRSAMSMRSALWQALAPDFSQADALIMTAAVADYRPAQSHSTKLKRSPNSLELELVPNPDLLAEIGHARRDRKPVLIGFALETDTDERVIQLARGKLAEKRVDLVVANHAAESLGRDDIRVMLVSPTDCEPLPELSKEQAADRILAWLAARFGELG
ncbi:MAG TPA: bifunctional phosphopantothenoylcysteine decarboxylase/phosphopantothenate--cysteine ligase CoaBC [Polyangiaceae bacterium]|nr:bifunctional phosphopantothenoylcysteine decarboxylase/phosphopantothenate--cysteine ligase CoaBC [Polyangiaceae bacterium]